MSSSEWNEGFPWEPQLSISPRIRKLQCNSASAIPGICALRPHTVNCTFPSRNSYEYLAHIPTDEGSLFLKTGKSESAQGGCFWTGAKFKTRRKQLLIKGKHWNQHGLHQLQPSCKKATLQSSRELYTAKLHFWARAEAVWLWCGLALPSWRSCFGIPMGFEDN